MSPKECSLALEEEIVVGDQMIHSDPQLKVLTKDAIRDKSSFRSEIEVFEIRGRIDVSF